MAGREATPGTQAHPTREGLRRSARVFFIALLVAMAIAYLVLVVLAGPGLILYAITLLWTFALLPLRLIATRVSGGLRRFRALPIILAGALLPALLAMVISTRSGAVEFLFGPLAVTITCYGAYRFGRAVWSSRGEGMDEVRTRHVLLAEAGLGTAALVAISLALAPDYAFGSVEDLKRDLRYTQAHAGCYQFALSWQRPAWMAGVATPALATPLRLDAITGAQASYHENVSVRRDLERTQLLIRPAPGQQAAYWEPIDSVRAVLWWIDGDTGRAMRLDRNGDAYVGYLLDVHFKSLSRLDQARVVGHRVDCSTVPADSR